MSDMRMRYTTLDTGHLYVILEGSATDIEKVLSMQEKVPGAGLTFRISITDRYGIAYREHYIFQPVDKKPFRYEMPK